MANLGNRPAQVEPERVVPEFRLALVVEIGEKGICVEIVVADVLVERAVELLRAALGGHDDHAAGGLAQVGCVIAG